MTTATASPPPPRPASAPGGGPLIDLHDVSKIYRRKVHALRGVSMRVGPGEIFGLLGPNGAGKSTLVKILMTVIRPTRCSGTFLGRPVGTKSVLGRVGYLPEHHRFPDYLTARQVMDFFGAMGDVPRNVRRRRTDELLDLVGLTRWADERVRGFSKGMRQRLGVAQALVNDPDMVLLDEPTDGVDPVGRRDIRNVLQEIKSKGKAVFLNSHLLSELEMVCDRVAIMVQGKVWAQGTIDELTAYGRRYEVEIVGNGAGADANAGAIEGALGRAGVTTGFAETGPPVQGAPPVRRGRLASGLDVEITGTSVRVPSDDPVTVQPIIDAARSAGLTIRALRAVRPSLEDLFMRAVTDPETGKVLGPGAADGGARP